MFESESNNNTESISAYGKRIARCSAIREFDTTKKDGKNNFEVELPSKKRRLLRSGKDGISDESKKSKLSEYPTEDKENGSDHADNEEEFNDGGRKLRGSLRANIMSNYDNDNSESGRKDRIRLRNSSVKNYQEFINDDSDTESEKDAVSSRRRSKKKVKGKQKKGKGKNKSDKIEEVEDNDSNYEVEEIIDVKYSENGDREFLIRWKGFSPEYDTWEPEDNLDCKDLVDDYFKNNTKEKQGEEIKTGEDEEKLPRFRKKIEENSKKRKSRRLEESQSSVASEKKLPERPSRSSSRITRGCVPTYENNSAENEEVEPKNVPELTKSKVEVESETKNIRLKKDHDKENVEEAKASPEDPDHSSDFEMGDSGEFEVQKILDVRYLKSGCREFYIKWKGFSSRHNTWEPEKHLNCNDKLEEFLKNADVPMRELRFYRKKTDRLALESRRKRKLSIRIQRQPRKSYIEDD